MCIQQGYVPHTCTMEGQMCWALVNSQGDPCKGCNANRGVCNGRHAPYEDKTYGLMCFLDKLSDINKKENEEYERRYKDLIQQRKEGHLNGFTRTILEIRWELSVRNKSYLEILVKDCIAEKAYIIRCDNIPEAISIARQACYKYKVEQIHVEENGIGMSIFDALTKEIDNIDIVPLRYTKMKIYE